MAKKGFWIKAGITLITLCLLMSSTSSGSVAAQAEGPVMLHPRLDVRPVVTGLNTASMIERVPQVSRTLSRSAG